MSYLLRLGAVALLMSGFLTFMLVDHALRRAGGTEVILNVQGYDPRDPLLGHYSRIQIELWTLDAMALPGDDEFEVRDEIYVVIEPRDDGSWSAVALSQTRPSGGVFLHGLVTSISQTSGEWQQRTDPETGETESVYVDGVQRRIYVNYNLNRYYASRDTAEALDAILRDESLTPRLIVSVQNNGDAIIKGLEIGGERQLDRLW